jgi:acyl-CoA reductase-like NAD-dependent aldehyde dehydrogenase
MDHRASADYWRKKAKTLSLRTEAFIDGAYRPAVAGGTLDCVNPANGQVFASVAACEAADVDLAVASARRAFEGGAWSRSTPQHRKRVLIRFAELLEENAEDLALMETLNVGKPISQSIETPLTSGPFPPDLSTAPNHLRWFGEAIDKIYDEVGPTGPDALSLITREPVGVVAAVVPWNFPLLMAAWKLAPALAAGNSVILKPAEQSPLSALKIAELAIAAGIPEGVLNVLPGTGEAAGRALGLHMDVDCVAFTGSGPVGKLFMTYAGQSNMKRIWLECGGKAPNIIMADCPDLDAAVEAAAYGAFHNQGEVCAAAPRLIVEQGLRETVLEKLRPYLEHFRPGDPLDPATRLGAIVTREQMDSVMGYIEAGRAAGAELVAGGTPAWQESGGYFIPPTIFDRVAPEMSIAREEIFGPVLTVHEVEGMDAAIALANATDYGLTASVWTGNLGRAMRFSREVRAGTVWINCYEASDVTSPFGGMKQSGNGRDRSLHALEKYTEMKSTWIAMS